MATVIDALSTEHREKYIPLQTSMVQTGLRATSVATTQDVNMSVGDRGIALHVHLEKPFLLLPEERGRAK